MKPTVYIETTIPSLLTAWPSRDVEIAAQQAATREWWETRAKYELCISEEVLREAARGDAAAAAQRLAALGDCIILPVTVEVERLTERILATGLIPPRALRDAIHIAVTAVHRADFLLTWNCRHINNATIQRQLDRVCHAAGHELPVICTPNGLLGSSPKT